jgi:hypothetical protein
VEEVAGEVETRLAELFGMVRTPDAVLVMSSTTAVRTPPSLDPATRDRLRRKYHKALVALTRF